MTALRTGLVAAALAVTGCASDHAGRRHEMPPPARESRAGAPTRSAGPAPASPRATVDPGTSPALARAVSELSGLVGQRTVVLRGVDYGPGCAALARAAFAESGHPVPPEARDATDLAALADRKGALTASRRPVTGDLVFLADVPGGPAEHVGLVTRTEPDGTAIVLHRVARGVLPVRVNLAYPARPTDPATGRQINDTLVVKQKAVPAGSLVVGVSDLLRRGDPGPGGDALRAAVLPPPSPAPQTARR